MSYETQPDSLVELRRWLSEQFAELSRTASESEQRLREFTDRLVRLRSTYS